MSACETVLWIRNGAETGVEPRCGHIIQSRELSSGELTSVSVHMPKICQLSVNKFGGLFLDLLKSCINSVTLNTFEIYNKWK